MADNKFPFVSICVSLPNNLDATPARFRVFPLSSGLGKLSSTSPPAMFLASAEIIPLIVANSGIGSHALATNDVNKSSTKFFLVAFSLNSSATTLTPSDVSFNVRRVGMFVTKIKPIGAPSELTSQFALFVMHSKKWILVASSAAPGPTVPISWTDLQARVTIDDSSLNSPPLDNTCNVDVIGCPFSNHSCAIADDVAVALTASTASKPRKMSFTLGIIYIPPIGSDISRSDSLTRTRHPRTPKHDGRPVSCLPFTEPTQDSRGGPIPGLANHEPSRLPRQGELEIEPSLKYRAAPYRSRIPSIF